MKLIDKNVGASMVEFIFAIPLVLFLIGGIIEMNFVFRSKTTLNTATFESVREGSLENVSKPKMRSALAAGMMPLFSFGRTDGAGMYEALAEAVIFENIVSNTASAFELDTVTIISPTRSVYDAFYTDDVALLDYDDQQVTLVSAIPNDNLKYRSTELKTVEVNGESVRMNIQDANLIKIKSLWCHRLKIPGLRDIAKKFVFDSPLFDITEEQEVCNAVGEIGEYQGVYVAITSQAIARSQSPVYSEHLE